MYAWKLWHDSGARTLTLLGGGLLWVSGALLLGQTGTASLAVAFRLLRDDQRIQQAAWAHIAASVASPVVIIGLLMAVTLCDVGLYGDFSKGTTDLLFTRPRPRRSFVWTEWAVGIGQTFAVMTVLTVFGVAFLYYLTGVVGNLRVLAAPILLLPAIGLVYGVGYLLGVLTRGRVGAAAAVALVALYPMASAAIVWYFQITPPRWWFTSILSWVTGSGDRFPVIALLGWIAVVLVAFMRTSQWIVDRAEV